MTKLLSWRPLLLCAVLCLLARLAIAGPQPRRVEARWNFTEGLLQKRLEIWVNCNHGTDLFSCSNKDFEKHVTPSADSFVFKSTDSVAIVAIFEVGTGEPDIKYAITGTNLDDKDLDALKKLFGATATAAKAESKDIRRDV